MLQRKSLIAFRVAVSAVFFTLLFTFLLPAIGKAQTPVKEHEGHQMPATSLQQETMPALTLNDLEAMALKNNPTLAQSEAALRAVEGQRVQAGLYPNPIIGYQGEGFSTRAFNQQSAHAFYIEQEIPLGGKLSKSRNIFAFGKTQAGFTAEAQKQRVLNAVRMLYYEALGIQQLIEVRTQLTKLGRDAVNVTGELFNVGQADRPDVLEIEVEAQRTQLDLLMAENERTQIWQQLGALVGNPMLKPTPLSGELGRGVPQLEQETLLARLLTESPEIKRAQTGIEKAKAVVTRAKAEMAPNLFVRGGWGYSNETLELRNQTIVKPPGAVGPQGFAQVGIRIPIFNRNQGGIATAQAELNIAEQERQRVELTIRARFSVNFRMYQNARQAAEQYEKQIIPRAQQAYDLYLAKFRQMAAAYPQVLIAQRTLFQVQAEYVRAVVTAQQNTVLLQGFLLSGGLESPMENANDTNTSANRGGQQ